MTQLVNFIRNGQDLRLGSGGETKGLRFCGTNSVRPVTFFQSCWLSIQRRKLMILAGLDPKMRRDGVDWLIDREGYGSGIAVVA